MDMPKIFAMIRKAVMSMEMWDVLEVAVIGNFSFSQFVMWNDIHNNRDFLEGNKIVHSLIEELWTGTARSRKKWIRRRLIYR